MFSSNQVGSMEAAESPGTPAASASAYYALFLLAAANLLCAGDRMIMSVLIEPIKLDLHLTDTQMGIVSGLAFAIFNAVALLPIGMLADRFSRRKLIAICLALWSGMTALGSQAHSFMQLLLIRIGVGVGEAGSGPIGISIIADNFPPQRRARAISIFFVSSPLGVLIAYSMGGWLAEHYSWRMAMFAAGVPGLFLAPLLWLTMADPQRGSAGAKPDKPMPFREAVTIVWQRRSVAHTMIGIGLLNFVVAGVSTWGPSFLLRSHHINLGTIGPLLAATSVAGMLGAFLGGQLTDRLAASDKRWLCWIPATAVLLAMIPLTGFLLAPSLLGAMSFNVVYGLLVAIYMGPSYSLIQTVVAPSMRATANSMTYLLSGAIGFGLGPLAVGMLSDALSPLGTASLRYGILAIAIVLAWSAFHLQRAARTLQADLAAQDSLN
ncbi:spinster family MFS transporter [Sphingobium estronivorans]|uniref:spinster family MFS transporter n=1 Tax=Sphingobium estronivorans TaxID=1577690 RepID=UPI00123B8472|nr:MFS transporter [Sphingobium estronivorans]